MSEQGEEIVPWGNRNFMWGGESGYSERGVPHGPHPTAQAPTLFDR